MAVKHTSDSKFNIKVVVFVFDVRVCKDSINGLFSGCAVKGYEDDLLGELTVWYKVVSITNKLFSVKVVGKIDMEAVEIRFDSSFSVDFYGFTLILSEGLIRKTVAVSTGSIQSSTMFPILSKDRLKINAETFLFVVFDAGNKDRIRVIRV